MQVEARRLCRLLSIAAVTGALALAPEARATEALLGAAPWVPRGGTTCPWLAAQDVAVELLLAVDEVDAPSLLRLDGQHMFSLRAAEGGEFAVVSIESIVRQPPGRLRVGGSGADGVAELRFARAGEPCDVLVTLPATLRRAQSSEAIGPLRADLQNSAEVARRIQLSNDLLRVKNDVKGALAPAQEAYDLARARLGDKAPLAALAAAMLASVQWRLGDNTAARDLGEFASAVYAERYGADAADTLEVRKNLALYWWELGDLAAARTEFERLRPAVLARFGERSNVALAMTSNMGALYGELGLVQEAVDMASFAYLEREARDGPNARSTLISLNNLANNLLSAGRKEDSERLRALSYQRHLAAFGPRDPDTLRAQHNHASALCDQDPPDCRLMEEVARLKLEVLGPEHPETIYSRQYFASQLLRQGRMAEALREFDALYPTQVKRMGARHWWTLQTVAGAGRAQALSGDADGGLARMLEALRGFEEVLGPTHQRTLDHLAHLANVCEKLMRSECRRAALDTLVERAESERGLDALRGQQKVGNTLRLVPRYRDLAELQASDGELESAVRTIERSKARELLATVGLRNAERIGGLPAAATQRIAALERELAALDDERNRALPAERLVQIEVRQAGLARELATLRADLRGRYPKYAAATQVDVPRAKILVRALAQDELFLGYASVANGFLVYTADARGKFEVRRVTVPHVRAAVEAWRAVIGTPDAPPLWRLEDGAFRVASQPPTDKARPAAREELADYLAEALLGPARERLVRYGRWIVSPDGALATLPFETLPWNGAQVVDRVNVRYAQSLAVYRLLHERPAGSGRGLFAMGGPTFSTSVKNGADALPHLNAKLSLGGGIDVSEMVLRSAGDPGATQRAFATLGIEWAPLPGAEREARAVAALFRGAAVYTGDDASEDRLQQLDASGELARYRYLLFSTHGYLSTETPALSSVVLRQPGSATSDGYVTAAEWAGYTLRSDLTVLSACETGLGKQVVGEGVMGLPYGLFVAGNRNTLLSLWKVPDQSTAEFMIRFFGKLRAGDSQATALARTKREFMQSTRFRDPLHWAGFVLYGS
jgi:hypothetical protein